MSAEQVQYELVYFPGVGRAEAARALLSLGDAKWKVTNVTQAEWASYKPTTPLGYLPILREYNPATGEQVLELSESSAIESYLASKVGANGTNDKEAALIASIRANFEGLFTKITATFLIQDAAEKAEAIKKLREPTAYLVAKHEKFLDANHKGGNGHYVGDKLSYADISGFQLVNLAKRFNLEDLVNEENAPLLNKVKIAVATNPGLQGYLQDVVARAAAQAAAASQ
ncbi:hypothetical protein GQ42DRAFT_162293 [Ramicandelaber brevisporus]|nr:hypothetical protein GQ42DRAFT_162293 [Ramicandelaber brevisporus]